jgi:hypothetical protein
MPKDKIYGLKIVAVNTRTGQKETLNVDSNGHKALGLSSLEHVMAFGARLYGRGWDTSEFSIESVERVERARISYRRS